MPETEVIEKVDDKADEKVTEALDFDQTCEAKVLGLDLAFAVLTLWRCRKPAKWVGASPCCGEHWLFCDKHRYNGVFICPRCRAENHDMTGWLKI